MRAGHDLDVHWNSGAHAVADLQLTTITVTNPVPDTSPLMDGTSLGSGVTQTVNSMADGVPCDRVGVRITRTSRASLRIASSDLEHLHGAQRRSLLPKGGPGPILAGPCGIESDDLPCDRRWEQRGTSSSLANSVGSGNRVQRLQRPGCTGSNAILASQSSVAWSPSRSGRSIGQLDWAPHRMRTATTARRRPISSLRPPSDRRPRTTSGSCSPAPNGSLASVDKAYHCKNVPVSAQPLCTTADPIQGFRALAATSTSSAPSGYATYLGTCDTTSAAIVFPDGESLWVNCPGVHGQGQRVADLGAAPSSSNGALSVEANGTLLVNTDGSTDASGYPYRRTARKQTSLIVNPSSAPAVNISSNFIECLHGADHHLQRRAASRSHPSQRRSTGRRPRAQTLKGLLYRLESESTQPLIIQGGAADQSQGQVVFARQRTADRGRRWDDRPLTKGAEDGSTP